MLDIEFCFGMDVLLYSKLGSVIFIVFVVVTILFVLEYGIVVVNISKYGWIPSSYFLWKLDSLNLLGRYIDSWLFAWLFLYIKQNSRTQKSRWWKPPNVYCMTLWRWPTRIKCFAWWISEVLKPLNVNLPEITNGSDINALNQFDSVFPLNLLMQTYCYCHGSLSIFGDAYIKLSCDNSFKIS